VQVVFEQVQDKLFILHKLLDGGVDQIRKGLDEEGLQVGQYGEGEHAAQIKSVRARILLRRYSFNPLIISDVFDFSRDGFDLFQ
jgi:hypothetical protein